MSLKDAFEGRINKCTQDCIKIKYNPSYFERMRKELGTVEAVKKLIRKDNASGFTKLWEINRLDLSLESIVQEPEWHDLFTDEEREIARKRLDILNNRR